jgi:hypothetical protein
MRMTSLILVALCLIFTSAMADIAEVGTYNDPGEAYGILIDGNYLYLADYNQGLRVMNILSPSNMVEVGFYNTLGRAMRVVKDGIYCYVADDNRGLVIIDVTTPSTPTFTGRYETAGYSKGLDISGDYAYLADGLYGLTVIDITDKALPDSVGNYNTAGRAIDVVVSGDGRYAFIADSLNGLVSVDLQDPENPSFLDSYDTAGQSIAVALDVTGHYLFVADGTDGLRVIDIFDPSDLVEVARLEGINARDVVISNNRAWIADNYSRLYVADVTDPENPFGIALYNGENTLAVYGVGVSGDYAYIAAMTGIASYGLRSYNVSDTYLALNKAIPAQEYVMVGIPIDTVSGNCETLFRDDFNNAAPGSPRWRVSRWDVPNQTYLRYLEADYPNDVGGEPPGFAPGLGFWVQEWPVRPTTTLDITIAQNQGFVAHDQRFPVTLQSMRIVDGDTSRGQNMIANPYPRIYDWRTTSFRNTTSGLIRTIANAASLGWISGYGYRWDYVTHSYITIRYSGAVEPYTLNPWEGFWVEVTTTNGMEVRFQPKGWAGGLAPELPEGGPEEIPGWELPLQISNFDNSYADTQNRIAIDADARDEYDPLDAFEFTPMSNSFVQLYFPHQFENVAARQYTFDFTEPKTWDFTVRIWYMPNQEFTLAWSDIDEIDNSYQFILESADTDEFIADLRTQDSFVFNSGNTNDQLLHYRVIVSHSSQAVEPGSDGLPGGYEFLNAYPNPFNDKINVSYLLSIPVNVNLRVFDIQGRELAVISQGLRNAGKHDLTWNAGDFKSGLYLIKLEAGDQTAIRKVLLLR